ncbi:unnamed protein product, partial [Prorocentrum cordatum]
AAPRTSSVVTYQWQQNKRKRTPKQQGQRQQQRWTQPWAKGWWTQPAQWPALATAPRPRAAVHAPAANHVEDLARLCEKLHKEGVVDQELLAAVQSAKDKAAQAAEAAKPDKGLDDQPRVVQNKITHKERTVARAAEYVEETRKVLADAQASFKAAEQAAQERADELRALTEKRVVLLQEMAAKASEITGMAKEDSEFMQAYNELKDAQRKAHESERALREKYKDHFASIPASGGPPAEPEATDPMDLDAAEQEKLFEDWCKGTGVDKDVMAQNMGQPWANEECEGHENLREGIEIYTANCNAWAKGVAFVDEYIAKPSCILGQEHRLDDNWKEEVQAATCKRARAIAMTPSATGARGGRSAGTYIMVPKSIGLTYAYGQQERDCSPAGVRGRICAARCPLWDTGGVLLVSAYMWTGEGLSERNLLILDRIGELTEMHAVPWILGMDAQLEPHTLHESGWFQDVGGVLHSTGNVTCDGIGGGREIDYFVVAKGLSPALSQVERVEDSEVPPHWPVRMRSLKQPREAKVLRFIKPRAFPMALPVGCAPQPQQWPPWPTNHTGRLDQEDLDNYWRKISRKAEEELMGICQIPEEERPRYRGRGDSPETVLTPLLGPRARDGVGQTVETTAWRWAANRLKDGSKDAAGLLHRMARWRHAERPSAPIANYKKDALELLDGQTLGIQALVDLAEYILHYVHWPTQVELLAYFLVPKPHEDQINVAVVKDLSRAFEHVTMGRLWEHGRKLGMPEQVLHFMIFIFAVERAVTLDDMVASTRMRTWSAAAEGSRGGTRALKCFTIILLDMAVVREAKESSMAYIQAAEAEGLPLSLTTHKNGVTEKGKSYVYTAGKQAKAKFKLWAKDWGLAIQEDGIQLGVDFTGGVGAQRRPKQQERGEVMVNRGTKLNILKKQGASLGTAKVAKLGFLPSMRCGVACIGVQVPLHTVAPKTIRYKLERAIERQVLTKWANEKGITEEAPMPFLEPVRALLKKRRWAAHQGAIKAYVGQDYCTQAKLQQRGTVADGMCQQCTRAQGTQRHRFGRCEAHEESRTKLADKHAGIVQRMAGTGESLLLNCGLVAHPIQDVEGDTRIEQYHSVNAEGDSVDEDDVMPFIPGVCFTDGSGKGVNMLKGYGWGYMRFEVPAEEGQYTTLGGAYGSMPGVRADLSVGRAELQAIWYALRRATAPTTLVTGYEMAVRGMRRGRLWCTAPQRSSCDIWMRICNVVDGTFQNMNGLTVMHVRAHGRGQNAFHVRGNRIADELAVKGAQLAMPPQWQIDAWLDRWKTVQQVVDYVADMAVEVGDFGDVVLPTKEEARAQRRREAQLRGRQPEAEET